VVVGGDLEFDPSATCGACMGDHRPEEIPAKPAAARLREHGDPA